MLMFIFRAPYLYYKFFDVREATISNKSALYRVINQDVDSLRSIDSLALCYHRKIKQNFTDKVIISFVKHMYSKVKKQAA